MRKQVSRFITVERPLVNQSSSCHAASVIFVRHDLETVFAHERLCGQSAQSGKLEMTYTANPGLTNVGLEVVNRLLGDNAQVHLYLIVISNATTQPIFHLWVSSFQSHFLYTPGIRTKGTPFIGDRFLCSLIGKRHPTVQFSVSASH